MLEFRTAIVDELGEVMYWCDELSQNEVEEILDNHVEWKKKCIEW